MLARLSADKVTPVTEIELWQEFDAWYGEQHQCSFIFWTKEHRAEADKAYGQLRTGAAKFEDFSSFPNATFPAVAGNGGYGPMPRTPAPGSREPWIAISKLRAGEISPPVEVDNQVVIIRCDKVTPADKTKSFDEEKPKLLASVTREKVERENAKLLAELLKRADPKYHLAFPDPAADPPPAPKK
jgi:hypothetical protein